MTIFMCKITMPGDRDWMPPPSGGCSIHDCDFDVYTGKHGFELCFYHFVESKNDELEDNDLEIVQAVYEITSYK